MTFYGARARLWACRRRQSHLEPVCPNNKEMGKKEEDQFCTTLKCLIQYPTPNDYTVTSLLDWMAGKATKVGDEATYVSIKAWGETYGHCLTNEGNAVYLGLSWLRVLIYYKGQLAPCYATFDSAGNE